MNKTFIVKLQRRTKQNKIYIFIIVSDTEQQQKKLTQGNHSRFVQDQNQTNIFIMFEEEKKQLSIFFYYYFQPKPNKQK